MDKKDIRILELLEQKRQLEAKCKRVDEYDEVVDLNDLLLEALEGADQLIYDLIGSMNQKQLNKLDGDRLENTRSGIEKAIAKAEGE